MAKRSRQLHLESGPCPEASGWVPNLCQCGDVEANPGPEVGGTHRTLDKAKQARSNSAGSQRRGKEGTPRYFEDPEADANMQSPDQRRGRSREPSGQSPDLPKRRSITQGTPTTVPARLDFQPPTPVPSKAAPPLDALATLCAGKVSVGPIGVGTLPSGKAFLHIPQLDTESVQYLEAHLNVQFDLVTHGDGHTIIPAGARMLSVANHMDLTSQELQDHHILLYPPSRMPFRDEPPLLSLKSWARLSSNALKSSSRRMSITLILPGRKIASDPREMVLMYPLFDWAPLRKFLTTRGAWLNPTVRLLQSGGAYSTVNPGLLAFWHFSSQGNFQRLEDPAVLQMPSVHSFTIQPSARYLRQHVILSGPAQVRGPSGKVHAMSAARWLMLLNNISPDEASTCVGHSTNLKYGTTCLPSVQWSNACPDRRSIAHMMIPQERMEELRDDIHEMDDISMFTITPACYAHLFVVSHWPSRRKGEGQRESNGTPVKMQSDEILTTLSACPFLDDHLGPMVEYTKWDALLYLKHPDRAEAVAEKVRNWDNLVLRSLHQQQMVRTPRNRYLQQPPRLWLQFPVALDPIFIIKELSTYVGFTESEPGTDLGTWVVTLATAETAKIMAGCHISCGDCGTATLTTGSAETDDDLNKQMKMEPSTPFMDRTMKIAELANRQLPRLSRQQLEGLQSGN